MINSLVVRSFALLLPLGVVKEFTQLDAPGFLQHHMAWLAVLAAREPVAVFVILGGQSGVLSGPSLYPVGDFLTLSSYSTISGSETT